MKTKKASESRAVTTRAVLPNETNPLGNLFGGQLMAWMDEISAISAQRHCQRIVVTASVNNISFAHPINLGATVTIEAQISRSFNSSMEIYLEVLLIWYGDWLASLV